jgi:hypothetical protein
MEMTMTTKTSKTSQSVKMIMLFALVFSVSFSTFSFLNAEATCGTADKYNATGDSYEDKDGVRGTLKISATSICGTTNNQSYTHVTMAAITSGTDFVEVGGADGYHTGLSVGSDDYHFVLINKNWYDNWGATHFLDASNEYPSYLTIPDFGDSTRYTVEYDRYEDFKDWYSVIIDTPDDDPFGIANIWTNGHGGDVMTQSEALNSESWIKVDASNLDYYGTSWANWDSSSAGWISGQGDNELCVTETASDHFKMGTQPSSTCLT